MIILLNGNDNCGLKKLKNKFAENKKKFFIAKVDEISGVENFYIAKKYVYDKILYAIYHNKIAVVDYNSISSFKTENERIFMMLLLKSMGLFQIECTKDDIKPNDKNIYVYNSDIAFFKDVLKEIAEFKVRLENNIIYSNLKSLAGFGYYLGDIMNPSANIVHVKGPSGEVLDFDDYMSFLISNPEYVKRLDVSLVRNNHPVSYFINASLTKK